MSGAADRGARPGRPGAAGPDPAQRRRPRLRHRPVRPPVAGHADRVDRGLSPTRSPAPSAGVRCWTWCSAPSCRCPRSSRSWSAAWARSRPSRCCRSCTSPLPRLMAVTADPRWLPIGKEQLATAALELLPAAEPGSDHQLAWMQLLGWTAVTPRAAGLPGRACWTGAGLYLGWRSIPSCGGLCCAGWPAMGRAGDADDRRRAGASTRPTLAAGMQRPAAPRSRTPSTRRRRGGCWPSRRSSGHEGVAAVAVGFGQAEHAELLAPYVDAVLRGAARDLGERAASTSSGCWPTGCSRSWAASPELLQRVDDFLAAEAARPVHGACADRASRRRRPGAAITRPIC